MKPRFFLAVGLPLLVVACGGGGQSNTGGSGGTGTSSASSGSGGAPTSSSSTTSSSGSSTTSSSASSTTSSSGTGGAPASGKWVSGYYVGYQQNLYPPSAIDWSGLTHLMIGRAVPRTDGTLDTTFDIDATNGPALAKQLASLAHQHGRKAVVMLGGAGEHAKWVSAASAAHRAAFVQNLKALAEDYGFDGFDLDWEPIEAADQPDFKALAQDMRAAMPSTILTVPVGWVNANFPDVDALYGEVAPLFDQINIMSYSMAGPWDGWQSWHSSALYGGGGNTPSSVDSSVAAYLAAGVPAAKLGVGIGFYGSCWSPPVTAPKSAIGSSQIIADDNIMTFANIMSAYYSAADRKWDDAAKAPYLSFSSAHGPQGCTFVSYEDEESILEKGKYVAQKGLGGAIVWTINEGHRADQPAAQQDPLMKALAQGFLQ
ncbi:Chitinase [Minicystis rosea]|nr:Chitinase [Minicystis rosea]